LGITISTVAALFAMIMAPLFYGLHSFTWHSIAQLRYGSLRFD